MNKVIIVGCGIIGAAIAYELSQIPELNITVLDQQLPAKAATGAALGVLMGVISQKIKGKNWQLRETSIRRYETLIPELENRTNRQIPWNQQGIISLCLEGEDIRKWENLQAIRQSQGWSLEIWDLDRLRDRCPYLNLNHITAAIYSPQDRQVDPTSLTLALVEAAQQNGVTFQFNVSVEAASENDRCQLKTTLGTLESDWLIIAAGNGSSPLTASLKHLVDIRPVLGQALLCRLENPLRIPNFQPVITGDDVHIVPCKHTLPMMEYWIGATVEFPTNGGEPVAEVEKLNEVKEKAIAFFPALAEATIIKKWSGMRPRPEGQPAPIISKLPGCDRIFLATGHYRNGILLAPGTALAVREAIIN